MSEKLSQELVKLATIHSHTMTVSDLMDAAAIVAEIANLQTELASAKEDSARLDAERAQWKRQGAEEELRRLAAEWGKRGRERRMLAQELVDRADDIKARREAADGTRA